MNKKTFPTVCDLFAGCGGLSLGFLQAGYDVRWANEMDEAAAATYRAAHLTTDILVEPAEQFYSRMMDHSSSLPRRGEVDVLIGGPPCQGFSGYNRRRSSTDPRNTLVEVFLDFVDYLKPRVVLMENVPGMLSLNGGKTPKLLEAALEKLGYEVKIGILQAGYYGLPQNRWRVFVLAVRKHSSVPNFPNPTHQFPQTTVFGATDFRNCVVRPWDQGTPFGKLRETTTVGDALRDLPRIENGGHAEECDYLSDAESSYSQMLRECCHALSNHHCSKLEDLNLQRCAALPKDTVCGWLDLPDHLKPANLKRHGDERYYNRFGRLSWGGTFNTILSRPHPYWSRVFHPEQDRVISVRESARAQGFPDKVRFEGSISSQYLQVGNAVPPPLAKIIAEEILRLI
jgi:DNA (cytosine-5)-methyltransferase 1